MMKNDWVRLVPSHRSARIVLALLAALLLIVFTIEVSYGPAP